MSTLPGTPPARSSDGSAGDADYGAIGPGYRDFRRPEARIAALIEQSLAGARTVLNVGAGAGSYESSGFEVTPVEPSAAMRAQRPAHLAPAIDAVAEDLPFADGAFDAAMTTFSVHQWSEMEQGLREMRRVTRGPVLVLTCDPDLVRDFWLYRYAPLVLDTEARRYPRIEEITRILGGRAEVTNVPIPRACTDGFNEAYYARPEMLLDPAARKACSAWSFVEPEVSARYTGHLRAELESGAWDEAYGPLRAQEDYQGSLVLISALPR
ncbi:class I SAM-dependent methyltransferase [Actinospica durhamensis]|uniref:Class I SAM-dependent methyltransferase n=1 Tax=Actinospica durhamensis TaxID=1508375 RepID=A0A941ITP3_9ACTN|nr:class I SAM-dependent methyltransferase [Actinospica durhamensis]MBR7834551.1 class I SAM-dependent methyltransferase [Actinospica durhamensis]